MNLADVNVPAKFTEEGITSAGNKTVSSRSICKMTALRQRAEKTILALADKNKVPVDEVVKKILLKSTAQLRRYIQSKGETPNTDLLMLCVQAALLRAEEIAIISKALDTTDADALIQIEMAEQDAIDNNNPDVKNILQPDVQAALKLTLDHIKKSSIENNGTGKLKDFILNVKRKSDADGFDLNTGVLLNMETGGSIGTKSPGGTNLPTGFPNGFDLGPIDPDAGIDYLRDNEIPVPAMGGFFNIFDKIVSGVNSVVSNIKTGISSTKSSITDLLGAAKDSASDIGADSITKSIKGYLPYIIGGVILFTLIIVIAIYASKHK